MKKLLLVCFACTLLVSLVAVAQSTKQDDPATQDTAKTKAPEKQAEKPVKGTMTVTGCRKATTPASCPSQAKTANCGVYVAARLS
jgi:hypothetical protein